MFSGMAGAGSRVTVELVVSGLSLRSCDTCSGKAKTSASARGGSFSQSLAVREARPKAEACPYAVLLSFRMPTFLPQVHDGFIRSRTAAMTRQISDVG